MNRPIQNAIEPRRREAVISALEHAHLILESVRKNFKEGGWDLTMVAPRPNSLKTDRRTYQTMMAKHNFYASLTERDEKAWNKLYYHTRNIAWTRPEPRVWSQKAVTRWLQSVDEQASAQFDAYIAKLESKIGECVEAKLAGENIWTGSLLTVVKPDGTVEKWKTQMIINVSCLGKLFNQWPTRKIK